MALSIFRTGSQVWSCETVTQEKNNNLIWLPQTWVAPKDCLEALRASASRSLRPCTTYPKIRGSSDAKSSAGRCRRQCIMTLITAIRTAGVLLPGPFPSPPLGFSCHIFLRIGSTVLLKDLTILSTPLDWSCAPSCPRSSGSKSSSMFSSSPSFSFSSFSSLSALFSISSPSSRSSSLSSSSAASFSISSRTPAFILPSLPRSLPPLPFPLLRPFPLPFPFPPFPFPFFPFPPFLFFSGNASRISGSFMVPNPWSNSGLGISCCGSGKRWRHSQAPRTIHRSRVSCLDRRKANWRTSCKHVDHETPRIHSPRHLTPVSA